MNVFSEKLKGFKERVEPIMWLIVSVLVPVVTGLLFVWQVFISPRIHEYANSLMSEIKAELNNHDKTINVIKHRVSDEFDSTYYFTKRYYLANPEMEQAPLEQFFYVGADDVVSLFIWSAGKGRMRMRISINDGPGKFLEDFRKRAWTNVDITEFIKGSSPLTDEQYQGISENVYNISITPIPNRIPPQSHGNASHAVSRKTIASIAEKGSEIDVYALLVIKRSPFK